RTCVTLAGSCNRNAQLVLRAPKWRRLQQERHMRVPRACSDARTPYATATQ
ncbi:MAG: hypothetical protein RL186_607, partial [Pseudomonadota bacterium]